MLVVHVMIFMRKRGTLSSNVSYSFTILNCLVNGQVCLLIKPKMRLYYQFMTVTMTIRTITIIHILMYIHHTKNTNITQFIQIEALLEVLKIDFPHSSYYK